MMATNFRCTTLVDELVSCGSRKSAIKNKTLVALKVENNDNSRRPRNISTDHEPQQENARNVRWSCVPYLEEFRRSADAPVRKLRKAYRRHRGKVRVLAAGHVADGGAKSVLRRKKQCA